MNDNMVHITIDGKKYTAEPGSTILGIINDNGIEHPQICYVPEVDPIQTCDTCNALMEKSMLGEAGFMTGLNTISYIPRVLEPLVTFW